MDAVDTSDSSFEELDLYAHDILKELGVKLYGPENERLDFIIKPKCEEAEKQALLDYQKVLREKLRLGEFPLELPKKVYSFDINSPPKPL